jgi:hypothetical protein
MTMAHPMTGVGSSVDPGRGAVPYFGGIARVNIGTVTQNGRPRYRSVFAALLLGAALAVPAAASTIYKWVDESGTMHLSSSKPPPGVKYETQNVGSSGAGAAKSPAGGGSGNAGRTSAASPAQAAQRSEILASLRNRECVIALEALDRLTSATQPTSPSEIKRLKQTADANCSSDPAHRKEQEEMAAQLRVANGADCVKARNDLADMMAKRTKATPEQLRAQQAFVDAHCIPPVQ